MTSFDTHTPYEKFEREHQRLRQGIAGLRGALLADSHGQNAPFAELVERVRSQLAVHFAFEENYGFKHYVKALRPAAVPEIDRLHREHREILALLAAISAGSIRQAADEKLRADLVSALEKIANHELDERKLLVGTFRR